MSNGWPSHQLALPGPSHQNIANKRQRRIFINMHTRVQMIDSIDSLRELGHVFADERACSPHARLHRQQTWR